MKKIISVILVLIMAVGLLSGCGASMDKINENTNITVATIGGQDIYAYELMYLMKMGATKEQALNEFQAIKTLVEKAKEYNVELGEEDIANVDAQWEELCTQFGSEEDFIKELANYSLTAEQYKEIIKMSALCDKFYGEFENLSLIEATDDETATNFYNNNFLRAKHILLANQDQAGNKLSEEEVAKKKAQAEDIVAKIKAGASFESFESLSEDPGSAASPNGYTFLNTKSETMKNDEELAGMFQQYGVAIMVPEFEAGTAALGFNEVSEIVESDYGYHIIKRLDPHGEGSEFDQLKSVIIYAIDSKKYSGVIEGWKAELKQKTNKYYDVLEVEPVAQTQAEVQE